MKKTAKPKPAAKQPAMLRELSTKLLEVWSGNSRTPTPEGLAELTASVAANGILQPLLARPVADYYEVVCGARRLVAARAAGLETVPAYVMHLDDRAAAAAVAAENICREDFAPLDALYAVAALIQATGSPQDAADALARPVGWVRRVASLMALVSPWKKAARERGLSLAFLCGVARLPESIQNAALERIDALCDREGGDTAALTRLTEQACASIHDAAWLAKDSQCAVCSARTDATPELFPELAKTKPCCLVPSCREKKRLAFIAAQKAAAAAKASTTPDKIQTAEWPRHDDAKKPDHRHTVPVVISQGADSGKVVWRATDHDRPDADATPKGPSPAQRLAARHIRETREAVNAGAVEDWADGKGSDDLLAAALIFGIHGEHPSEDAIVARFKALSAATNYDAEEEVADRILHGIEERLRFDKVSDCDSAYAWSVAIREIFNIPQDAAAKGAQA